MSYPTFILGQNNWAVSSSSILGYEYGDLSGQFSPVFLTSSRASTATYVNAAGLIVTASNNISRIDYSTGTGSLLLEPQRTNSIRNNTMQGAVVGTPGTTPTIWSFDLVGLSRQVVSIGTENGLSYVDLRFFGTATGTAFRIVLEQNAAIPASNGQNWTFSTYFKIISATLAPNNYSQFVFENTSAGVFVRASVQNFTPTTNLQRFALTTTLSGGATVGAVQPLFNFALTNGASYDFTIRIASPQMELGAYATTPIFTSGATATRLVDTFNRANMVTNGYIGPSGSTWFVELKNNVSYTRDAASEGLFIGDTSDGATNCLQIIAPLGGGRLRINKRIATIGTSLYNTVTDNVKIAIKWNGTIADVFVNGVKVVSATAFTTTNMEFLAASGTQVPTFIQAMLLYDYPLPDSELITLTTL